LKGDYPQASPETVIIYQDEAIQLASLLLQMTRTKLDALRELQALFHQHPDYPIFSSLPGAGDLLEPALLVKFGDDRARFPTPASVQALAGTCPVTDKSGKRKVIKFRKACDREWRSLAQAWAIALVNSAKSPGSSGKLTSPTTKHIIFNSARHAAKRRFNNVTFDMSA
jgi:transposase